MVHMPDFCHQGGNVLIYTMNLAPTLCHLSKNKARMLPALMKLVREMTLNKSASKSTHDYKFQVRTKRKTAGWC